MNDSRLRDRKKSGWVLETSIQPAHLPESKIGAAAALSSKSTWWAGSRFVLLRISLFWTSRQLLTHSPARDSAPRNMDCWSRFPGQGGVPVATDSRSERM